MVGIPDSVPVPVQFNGRSLRMSIFFGRAAAACSGPGAMNDEYQDQGEIRRQVGHAVYKSLLQIGGGGFWTDGKNQDTSNAEMHSGGVEWGAVCKNVAHSSVSFPNKSASSIDGKPHDIEIRVAPSLFYRYAGKKRKRSLTHSHCKNAADVPALTAKSQFGLERSVHSPRELADLICLPLEEFCRDQGLSHDVRPDNAGIICLVSPDRAIRLRRAGRLPCSMCIKWCKGEKGLWWHQQREHGSEHSIATAAAASERTVLALIPYEPSFAVATLQTRSNNGDSRSAAANSPRRDADADVFSFVKQGDMANIVLAIQSGVDPKSTLDRNGASMLLWAAGTGRRQITQYLVETCGCDPNQGQRGKRAFAGRTALHWAARNGHLDTVQYLVSGCGVDINAVTGDGTTAFCWASWQGHLTVMMFLREKGCDVHRINSFGCNAVLWCAQGGNNVETMKWLQAIGCDFALVNSNGHGTLHKIAQRNQRKVADWLCSFVYNVQSSRGSTDCAHFGIIGPDSDGCCPSDLAGMEGHVELARYLVEREKRLAGCLYNEMGRSETSIPSWLSTHSSISKGHTTYWEPFAGVQRIVEGIAACEQWQ